MVAYIYLQMVYFGWIQAAGSYKSSILIGLQPKPLCFVNFTYSCQFIEWYLVQTPQRKSQKYHLKLLKLRLSRFIDANSLQNQTDKPPRFLYNIIPLNQRMQQQGKSITDKYKRQLRAEDFVLIAQQNKDYKNLFKIMTEKEAVLTTQLSELQKKVERLQNQKEEYKLRNNQYLLKLSQYESIKQQLFREYKILKKEIDQKVNKRVQQQREFDGMIIKMENLLEKNVLLQQDNKRKDIIIEELRDHLKVLEKEVMQKKIKLFSHMIQTQHIRPPTKSTLKKPKQKRKEVSFMQSSKAQTNSRVAGKSEINSISFSLVSEQSDENGRSKRSNVHNKSIYI